MDNIYKLRTNFAIIGLTGRSGAGCSEIARRLSSDDYIKKIDFEKTSKENQTVDEVKLDICLKYLKYDQNWKSFKVIKYSAVLIYHLLYESCYGKDFVESKKSVVNHIISSCGKFRKFRFTENDETMVSSIIDRIFPEELYSILSNHDCINLEICLRNKEPNDLVYYFWDHVTPFSENLLIELKKYDYPKAALLVQDLACNLRSFGTISVGSMANIENSYTVAETINRIIKKYRKQEDGNGKLIGHGRIVIDSLKNSLELIYFKEKYSGFYCIASNKITQEAKDYKKRIFDKEYGSKSELWFKTNLNIDKEEYKGNEVNKGIFSSPDIENCIQKSDYHIFWSENFNDYDYLVNNEEKNNVDLDRQLVKFLSLLYVPGIITPSAVERNMQIAFNAKVNSGCISRQVGAVITDENYSVKAIGWNDVARYQVPCNLRNIEDLINGDKNQNHFSDIEKGSRNIYNDEKNFKEKITEEYKKINITEMNGRICSFCFKSCHNAFEGKENQVHTRSLHAEENAMLQITKYGGQGVKGGYLFTTASPCELCSKKAFQLGITTIYYIDPYPGIAGEHILTSAINPKKNPIVKMFRGAVGRSFHKLYEPFVNYKDEIHMRTNFKPETDSTYYISKLSNDEAVQQKIKDLLNT